MSSTTRRTRPLRNAVASWALASLVSCSRDVELGTECEPTRGCPRGDAGMVDRDADTGEIDASVEDPRDSATSPPDDGGTSSDATDPPSDAQSDAPYTFVPLTNGAFELTQGAPGAIAFQVTGSPPIGNNLIEPWQACVSPPDQIETAAQATTSAGATISPTSGETFVRKDVIPSTLVGLQQAFTSPPVPGTRYGFRIDLRSTTATQDVYLAVYTTTVQCLPNTTTPIGQSRTVDDSQWFSTCITFSLPNGSSAILLVPSADGDPGGAALLMDNLRDDPSCAAAPP